MKKGTCVALAIIFGFLAFCFFLTASAIPSDGQGGLILFGIAFTVLAIRFIAKAYYFKNPAEIEEEQKAGAKIQEADAYFEDKAKQADEYFAEKFQESNALAEEIEKMKQERTELNRQIKQAKKDVRELELHVITGSVRVGDYDNLRSDEIKNQLSILRSKQDDAVKDGSAVQITGTYSSKKAQNDQVKQILRCFNSECAGIIGDVTVKNADASRAKIQRAYATINKIFQVDGVEISYPYLSLKLEELSLVYSYMVKEEEEREQKKAIREQMLEEEKVRREIEREKQKLEKEESHFSGEVKKLMSYLQKSKDDVERQLYIDKIQELEEKLKALQADKENVLQREQNTRAGFVYIISNLGSFGEDVYKIGMTRRLDPMDRIAELSSASVPFPFDVHAMIFSEDAPGLETILHQYFDKLRVNKVNPRKEFFRVDLEEIKKVVLEHHNATTHFVDIPDAIEYRQTLQLEEKPAVTTV